MNSFDPRTLKTEARQYALPVDPLQNDRAQKYKLCSFDRPHMRAFHLSWFGFSVAFLAWFSFAPMMPLVQETLGLSKNEIWVANICSVSSTILFRIMIGPFCDRFGGKWTMGAILMIFALPVGLGGFVVHSATDLAVMRFFIGIVGCIFVPCQYWVSAMFTHQISGATQAVVAGWGNVGGGVTQFFMPLVYSGFKAVMSEEAAWRSSFIVPAILNFVVGLLIVCLADDCPQGQYRNLQKGGQMAKNNPTRAFLEAASAADSWILFLQYACCSGVGLTVNNLVASYFYSEFGLSLVSAGSVASSFFLMNLFARAVGGMLSDFAFKRIYFGTHPLNSRILVQGLILLFEGIMIFTFSRCKTLGTAIFVLLLFSLGVQAGSGSTMALVPYVKGPVTGSVAGIVGAGGNVGAMCWGFMFLLGPDRPQDCLVIISLIVVASTVSSFFLKFSDAKVQLKENDKQNDDMVEAPVEAPTMTDSAR